MTEGPKHNDKLLHKEIILEYNNNELAHHIACCSNPAMFHPITLVQSKETLATVIREYERSFVYWRLYG